ncbi:MAG: hypothetical protein GF353_16330 [Candidatus Lokiarchaeota archaeon]|nr:hypothetical protein [Candidatus Lokiarchaeota archaeon]
MEDSVSKKIENETKKTEIDLQFHWYLFSFFVIYLVSFLIPGIILLLYVLIFFKPYVLDNPSLTGLFFNWQPLTFLMILPLMVIGCYLLHLLFVGLITKILWGITEKKCPTVGGIIQRNVPSKMLNYYHIRSFLLKYPKNAFVKGPFPWLVNWLFNFVGSSKIGKGSTVEEEIAADKFVDIGENCYIGVNSAICSHTVEGIFGRIPYFEINLGDNVTCSAFNIVGPGSELQDNSYLLPLGCTGKHQVTKGNNFYFGIPMRKIFKRKIIDYLKVSKADLKDEKEISKIQESEIENQ